MPVKKAATKTKSAGRKVQAKKANASMKNSPKDKTPKAKSRSDASKAARTMAKTVKPGMRKSAAKRVEKDELRAVRVPLARRLEEGGHEEVRKHANRMMATLRKDFAEAGSSRAKQEKCRELVLALSRTMTNTKKKQGLAFD